MNSVDGGGVWTWVSSGDEPQLFAQYCDEALGRPISAEAVLKASRTGRAGPAQLLGLIDDQPAGSVFFNPIDSVMVVEANALPGLDRDALKQLLDAAAAFSEVVTDRSGMRVFVFWSTDLGKSLAGRFPEAEPVNALVASQDGDPLGLVTTPIDDPNGYLLVGRSSCVVDEDARLVLEAAMGRPDFFDQRG